MSKLTVNEDLVKERLKCNFNVNELIHFIDGDESITNERKEIEEDVLSRKELKEDVPEEYLSHKERYERSVKRVCAVVDVIQAHALSNSSHESYRPSYRYNVAATVVKDASPIMLHMAMFVPTIFSQASQEQANEWLPKAQSLEIIGTYAQTELGHGTFLRGLETTATYDPKTEQFVLNTPTLTAHKWWPGGLAQTANHCIVVAQLYTNGKCYGVHPFIVQIRDSETHMPLPGISVGEIGPKLGYQTANNGFLGFDNFRIPRNCMLMKHAQVKKDGSYVRSQNEKLTYGTMVMVRVFLVHDVAYELARAATIATRYSAVRRQGLPKPQDPEPQVLDYLTQQHKLFICIATSHAFRIAGLWLWRTHSRCIKDMAKGNMNQLPELHALSCCLKAICSKDAASCVEQCRLACGGHGFMTSSNLPIIYGLVTATVTYEGEYTVLLLQTSRYLVKAWKQAMQGNALTENVAYMVEFIKNNNKKKWENGPTGIIKGFQAAAAGKTQAAHDTIQQHQNAGKDYEDAWNLSSVQLVNASEAHCRAVICQIFWEEVLRHSASLSKELGEVLMHLAELYLIYWTLEKKGDLFMYSTLSGADVFRLQQRYEELLALIRPNSIGLVDGFDIRDEILNSTLGAYDGRVYERLMEEALKSPLNAEPVNRSFHEYLKPLMMKAKL